MVVRKRRRRGAEEEGRLPDIGRKEVLERWMVDTVDDEQEGFQCFRGWLDGTW